MRGKGRATYGSTLDVVLVVDDSASMWRAPAGAPAAARLEAAHLAVSLLPSGARAAFVSFGAAGSGCVVPLQTIDRGDDREALMERMTAATFEKGGTDYGEAHRSIIDALVDGDVAYGWPPYRAEGRTVAILFVSDGRPGLDPRRLQDQRRLRERAWPVHTVGVGSAAHEPDAGLVLRELAESSGGRARLATTVDELLNACAGIVADLGGHGWTAAQPPAATPLVSRFALPPGVREATFVAVKSAEDQTLLLRGPLGAEASGAARRSGRRFELAAVTGPPAGTWTATVTGSGRAGVGLLTCAKRRPAAGPGGAHPTEE